MSNTKKNTKVKKKVDPKDRIDPKPWIIGAVCICLFIGAILLYDFLSVYLPIVSLKQKDDGSLYDSKNKITYTEAPRCYKAVLVVTDPQYARVGKIPVYEIAYRNLEEKVVPIDTARYLSTDNDNGAVLYYNADKVILPTLEDFDNEKSYVCSVEGVIFSRAELTKTETSKVIKSFVDGVNTSVSGKVKETYELRIKSGSYDWLFYCMEFTMTENGNYYITDYVSQKTVMADKELFDEFFGEVKKDTN